MRDTKYLLLIEIVIVATVVALFILFQLTPEWLLVVGIAIGLLLGILIYDVVIDFVRKRRARAPEKKIGQQELLEIPPEELAEPKAHLKEVFELLEEGKKLLKEGEPEKALEKFLAASKVEPSSSRIYNQIGLAYSKMGRFTNAIEAYQRAIALDFRNPSAHFNLALAFERTERYQEAMEAWKNYEMVGKIMGEREDLLDNAKKRIQELQKRVGGPPKRR